MRFLFQLTPDLSPSRRSDPTLEDSYRKQVTVDKEECVLDIFDTAGQEDFSAVRDQYMRTGDGFLCVYSITYGVSFNEVQSLYDHILRVKDMSKVPFVLIGNKCDLTDEREVPLEKGKELAEQLSCPFMESSAKTNTNVSEAFQELVRAIKKHRKEFPPPGAPAKGGSGGETAQSGSGSKREGGKKRCAIV
jgi:GTPase KRas